MILPDWTLFIQWINFLVLLYLLNRFLFKPILGRMEDRDRLIKERLEEAAADRSQAEKRMAEYEEAVAAARREGMEALSAVSKAAAEEVRRMVDEKRLEAEKMVEEARVRIERQSREAESAMEGQVRDLAAAIGRKVAGREIHV